MTPRSITLQLPMPPTANTYWRFVPKIGRPLLSREAREYRATIIRLIEQRGCNWYSGARLSLDIELRFDTRRRCDVSNRIKALEDALQAAGVFLNDEQVDELSIRRGEQHELCALAIVTIRELAEVQPELELEGDSHHGSAGLQ